ncbi:MAG TPA: 2-dehydropantoate 2-reductase [Candidatus Binatia bacterium]|nr:2-dehydropantoate 2-reductase [Candidatus Binatia bacterium]
MRIAVIGTGAVGGYFGAKLAAAGHELVFLARGKHLEALQAAGLRILSPNGDLHIQKADFLGNAAQVGVVDLILFCVKSYDTQAAAESLGPLLTTNTAVVSLQNGVDNPEKIAAIWRDQRIYPGVVYIGAEIASPGVIRHSNGGKIVFGAPDGQADESAVRIEQLLSQAEIPCQLSANIHEVQWSKLLWNAPFCAISCLARADVKQIVDSAPLTRLAIDCMAEVQSAAELRGITLPRTSFDQTIAFSRGLGAFKPSMLQDLEAGKPLEYEAFNGIVAKLLQDSGKAAPINQAFHSLLQHLDKSTRESTKPT